MIPSTTVPAAPKEKAPPRGRLFRKYVGLFLAVVCVALLTNGLSEIWFSYQEHKASLIRIQREQAEAAAPRSASSSRKSRARSAGPRSCPGRPARSTSGASTACGCLRQVPAITELAQLDSTGTRAIARLAAGHGCGGEPERLLQGAEIRRGGGEQGLLRPGLFPPRIRALHDAGAGRHAARCRRERRRGQSQAHLGRRVPDQGRRARPGLCGRRAGAGSSRIPTSAWCCATPTCRGWRRCRPRAQPAPARRRSSCRRPTTFTAGEVLTAYAPVSAARLARVRRTAGSDEAYAPLYRLDRALRHRCSGWRWPCLRRRPLPCAQDGRSDPGLARRRRAHRQRRSRAAHLDQDRRRTGGARRPVQRHGRKLQESYADLEKKVEIAPTSWRNRSASCARWARSARRSTPRSTSRRC